MQQIVYVALATLGVLLVAAAAALVVFASGVAAQGESPLPTPVAQSPLDNPPAPDDNDEDDEQEIALPPRELPPVWPSPVPSFTPTQTQAPPSTLTQTRTPTPITQWAQSAIPTVALPTLTPDYPATLEALCGNADPCRPSVLPPCE